MSSDEGMEFRGDLNIQKITFDLIQVVNHARGQVDAATFSEIVDQLMLQLPWQQQIEIEDESEDYIDHIEEWRAVMIDGELGSSDPDHPDLINIPGTLRYNPKFNDGKPKQISPTFVTEDRENTRAKLKKIMQKLQNIGYTHKQDEQMNDGGDIPKGEVPPPTPTLAIPDAEDDEEDGDEG